MTFTAALLGASRRQLVPWGRRKWAQPSRMYHFPSPRPRPPNPPTPGSGVRGDGRNREEGSLGSSRGGAMAWGPHAGAGVSPAPIKCRESCMWPMFPARGAGRGIRDHFEGLREPPSGTFGVRNWIPRRPQHGFRSFPRHVSTTSFPWGRRQWAQPSRMYHFLSSWAHPRPRPPKCTTFLAAGPTPRPHPQIRRPPGPACGEARGN